MSRASSCSPQGPRCKAEVQLYLMVLPSTCTTSEPRHCIVIIIVPSLRMARNLPLLLACSVSAIFLLYLENSCSGKRGASLPSPWAAVSDFGSWKDDAVALPLLSGAAVLLYGLYACASVLISILRSLARAASRILAWSPKPTKANHKPRCEYTSFATPLHPLGKLCLNA